MLNLIVLNRTKYLHRNGFGVKKPTKFDIHKIQPTYQQLSVNTVFLKIIQFSISTQFKC